MIRISPRRVSVLVYRAMYGTLFLLVSAAFFTVLYTFLVSAQFLALAAVYAPTLALLFGFASVLYGRSRAFPSGPEQRRCLYAAERALQAALLFMVAGALGAVIASFLWARSEHNPAVLRDEISMANWFFLPIMLGLMAFGAFFFSLRAIGHRLLGWVHLRQLIRRIRRAP